MLSEWLSCKPVRVLPAHFGLYVEHPADDSCSMVDFHRFLYNYNIVTAHLDASGNLWMGSDGGGLYFISKVRQLFNVVSRKKTWCVCSDADDVCWFGGEGVVVSIDPKGAVAEYRLRHEGIDKGYVLSIEVEDEGHLLLAAYERLFRFDKRTGTIEEVTTAEGTSVNAISFYRDKDGSIWTSAMDGVYRLKDRKIAKHGLLSRQMGNQMTNGIRRDREGKIWVATYDAGVYLFDATGNLMRTINQRNGFFANSVHHLYMDTESRIWMSTPDGVGLISDTRRPDSISVIGYRQGLKDPFIRAIHEDSKGNIWVSTNNSLSMLNIDDGSVTNYGKDDGLPITNFTGGIAILPSGRLYVTSLEGVCCLSLNELVNESHHPRLNIYQCCSFDADDSREPQPIRADDKGVFKLDYSQNNFRIYYCIDNIALTRRMEYSYMVKGKGGKWHPVGLNYISFREMTPGKYTIVVRARLHGQAWNDSSTDEVTVVVGKPFWMEWYAMAFYWLVIVSMVALLFVRYRKRMVEKNEMEMQRMKNQEDKRMNEERMQFITNITHELKTPITLLTGPVESLLGSNALCEGDREKVRLMDNSSKRLRQLVEQILKFRKLESGKHSLTVEKGNLAELVARIGHNFITTNTKSRLEIRTEMPEQPLPDVYFDREAITTIINNLMTNAVKYTEEGVVTLRMEEVTEGARRFMRISVSDTGCGIPQEKLHSIFDKFYQVGGKMQAEGTGIGLSIVKSLAECHKTQIKVESRLDCGSTFSFMLDAEETYPDCMHKESEPQGYDKAVTAENPAAQPAAGDKPIVLIVEDNTDMNNFIAGSLTDEYYIIQTSNGKEGLDAALAQVPDVIVSDIMMPVMDGEQMLAELKNDVRTSHIPVILLTAKTSDEELTEGYESGADVYLTKPFSVKALRSCINNTILRRKRFVDYIGGGGHASPPADGDGKMPQLSVIDRGFLADLDRIIDENMSSSALSTTMIAAELKVSQTTLYRKMKALKGMSANEYVRKRRIAHAIHCMTELRQNISEAAFNSGFNDMKHFRACFREETGVNPSEYLRKQ